MTENNTPLFTAEDKACVGNQMESRKAILIYVLFLLIILLLAIKKGFIILLAAIPFIFGIKSALSAKSADSYNYNLFHFYEDNYTNIDSLSQTTIPYELVVKAVEDKSSFRIHIEKT